MTVHQFPLRAVRPCDTEPMCQNAYDWPYVRTPRVYTPTMLNATLLIRIVYWAKHLAVALFAIAASVALGAGLGALALWMNTP